MATSTSPLRRASASEGSHILRRFTVTRGALAANRPIKCGATFDAEYVALAQLQADALITLDRHLADAVRDLVTVAPIEALF